MPRRVLLVNDTSFLPHHGCQGVMHQIETALAERKLSVSQRWPVHADWFARPQWRQEIAEADLVLVNGEGTLHHDAPAPRRIGRVAREAKAAGVPCSLINSVYDAVPADVAAHVAAFGYRSVRESRSHTAAAADGLSADVTPDLLLLEERRECPSGGGVLLTDSTVRAVRQRLYRASRERTDAGYLTLLAPPRTWPLDSPHAADARRRQRAYELRRRVYPAVAAVLPLGERRRCDMNRFRHIANTRDEALTSIGSASLVVAGRFHAVCMCLVQETPFVAVGSNTHKIEGLLGDAGLGRRVVADADEAAAVDPEAWQWTDEERASLAAFKADLPRRAAAMFDRALEPAQAATRHAA